MLPKERDKALKILAFSDLHRDKKLAKEIVYHSRYSDVVVGAGDFAMCGKGISNTLDILKTITVPAIIIAGNHETMADFRWATSDWNQCWLLHGNSVEIKGVRFFGLGGEVPRTMDENWNNFCDEDNAAEYLAHCPDKAVLVTHAPPFGTHTDIAVNGTHVGSKSIRQAIERTKPVIALCGHIHHSWGTKDKIGATLVHNLGPSLNWFSI